MARFRFRRRHGVALFILALLVVPVLWVLLAYTALPRLWLHHELKKGPHEAMTAFTAQDIPGDPINLHITGSDHALGCLLVAQGWHRAAPVNFKTSLGIIGSIAFQKTDNHAPVSPLYVDGQQQALAYEMLEGKSADKRHHVRFWRVGPNDWLGAATFDRGVGFSLFTLQVTHHIGPQVDKDRAMVGAGLIRGGAHAIADEYSNLGAGQRHRNGGGDVYFTDGRILRVILPDNAACAKGDEG